MAKNVDAYITIKIIIANFFEAFAKLVTDCQIIKFRIISKKPSIIAGNF